MRDIAVAGARRTQVIGHVTSTDDNFGLVLVVSNRVAAIEAGFEQKWFDDGRRPLGLHDEGRADPLKKCRLGRTCGERFWWPLSRSL